MVYMFTVKHNYILGGMFTNTKAKLHASAINVVHLQAVHPIQEHYITGWSGLQQEITVLLYIAPSAYDRDS